MNPTGAVFQPELIQLMKSVLDDATAMLPEAKRTSTMKAEIASQILACAAKGERDPMVLKNSALLAIVDCTHYSHDISPERLMFIALYRYGLTQAAALRFRFGGFFAHARGLLCAGAVLALTITPTI